MTTTFTTPPAGTKAGSVSRLPIAPVAAVTVIAAVTAAIITTGFGAIAIAVHGSMRAGDPGASKAASINAFSFGIGTLMSCALGVVIAVLIARFATNAARRWTQVSVGLLGVSLIFPLIASHTDNATRLVLATAHLIAGAIVIPTVRRRLGQLRGD